ncbi:FUSC family protein [Rhodanobacter lindaniclasticus]
MSAVVDKVEAAPARQPWLADFLAGEWASWRFVFKALLAMYLAVWLAMWLQLEKPTTTLITVAIVMHPQSGMVLAKSFFRAIGTLAGSTFALVLMALFPQQRELFLGTLALWVALCAGGATLYRNFMSYGFVLAGYTAAIVVLPAITDPLLVFDSAVMRVSEVLLGVVVAGVVSDAVWPERLREVLRRNAREQFAHFLDFARNSTGGTLARGEMEQAYLRFVRAAVQLENLRAAVIFEDPEARARSSRMRLLNQYYMAATSSFQSVHRLINRLQRGGREVVVDALVALYRPISQALSPEPAGQHEPSVLAPRLRECESQQPRQVEHLRGTLPDDARTLIEFDTGAALLRRFTSELRHFTEVESTLRAKRLRGNVERVSFRRGNDYAGASVAVLRTFLTMVGLSVFWLASGWPYGSVAMLLATVFAGIMATVPNPVGAVLNAVISQGVGMLAAFVVTFWILPRCDGFPMLIMATLPFFLVGLYLQTRVGKLASFGLGYTVGLAFTVVLGNPMVYAPEVFVNTVIAQLFGYGFSGAMFLVIPSLVGTAWQRRRQLRQLRQQVVRAATEPLSGDLMHSFESISRDLFEQVVAHTKPDSRDSRDLLAWALSVHDSGRALIELRQVLAANPVPATVAAVTRQAVQDVARLYANPDATRWQQADQAMSAAIAAAAAAQTEAHVGIRRVLLRLYQLRSGLRDDESALAAYQNTPEPARAT